MQRSRSKPTVVTRLNDKSLDLKRQVAALKSKDQSFTDWIYVGGVNAPAFQGTWVNSGDGTTSVILASFIRDSSGWVHLQGVIKSGVIQTTAFILPTGLRPGKPVNSVSGEYVFPVYANGAFGAVLITSNGEVKPWVGSVASIHLTGISFRAES